MGTAGILEGAAAAACAGAGCSGACGLGIGAFLPGYLITHTKSMGESLRAFLCFYLGKALAVATVCVASSLIGRQLVRADGMAGMLDVGLAADIFMLVMGLYFVVNWIKGKPGRRFGSTVRLRVLEKFRLFKRDEGLLGSGSAAEAWPVGSATESRPGNSVGTGAALGVQPVGTAGTGAVVEAQPAGSADMVAAVEAQPMGSVHTGTAAEARGCGGCSGCVRGREKLPASGGRISYGALFGLGAGYGITPCAPLLMMAGVCAAVSPAAALVSGGIFALSSSLAPFLILAVLSGLLSAEFRKELSGCLGYFQFLTYLVLMAVGISRLAGHFL